MPSTAPWARYDPRIRLMIDGKEIPCIRCTVDFELNAIPQASATLAVGRGFDGKPSPAHALVADFVDRAPAEIYITPNPETGAGSALQPGDLNLSGEVRIFDGFVTAAGFTRSRGQAQFTIQMEHWLSEMGFSSIFSKSSHPSNPGHYAYTALALLNGTGAFSNMGISYEHVTGAKITSDFWGDALKPFLEMLCKQDGFQSWDPALKGFGKNDGALAALKRFNSPCQQKLSLDIKTIDQTIVSNIRTHVGEVVGKPAKLANQTMWDVLISSFCSQYLFSIVPRVEDAIAVPFIPGYRTVWTTIKADNETHIEWMRGLGRTLRGVGILTGVTTTTNALKPGQAAPQKLRMGGFYSPDRKAPGLIVMKEGPQWMSKLFSPQESSGVSSGGTGKAIGNAIQPGGKQVNNVPDEVATRLKDTIRPFLNKYAQAHYALEKLRTRNAICSCPFRLDIAPGSSVKVENEGEPFVPGDPFGVPIYGHVARVSLAVDGEQPMIGTSFHLSHIRSEQENKSDKTSIAKHPLYKDTFTGCALVDL